jgi:hypothetical protein
MPVRPDRIMIMFRARKKKPAGEIPRAFLSMLSVLAGGPVRRRPMTGQ